MHIDLNAVAERARAAGKNPAQFVRECFEAATSKAPAGPVTAPLPTLQMRTGGTPSPTVQARTVGASVGNLLEAAQAQAEADALILAAVRAALTGVRGKSLSKAEVVLSVDDALRALLDALKRGFGLTLRAALEAVLRQAQQTFYWQQREIGVRQEQVARFVFRLAQAAMNVFSATAQSVSQTLCQVIVTSANVLGGALSVVLAVVIAILKAGAGGTLPTRIADLIGASAEMIATAIGIALGAGIPIAKILLTGVDYMGRSSFDWAVTACAALRGSINDLAREMAATLGLTIEQIALALVRASFQLGEITDALIANFGRDAGQLARALKAAQVSWQDIASQLKNKLGSGASTIAQALKDLGASAHDVAVALRAAGFSATETGQELRDRFGLNSEQVNLELNNANYRMEEVQQAISNLFKKVSDTFAGVIRAIG